jgi:hypothetical protein
MKIINKTILSEKITAINLTKIIHRVIISISSRVSHTIIITAALIIIPLIPLISRIIQIDWINAD